MEQPEVNIVEPIDYMRWEVADLVWGDDPEPGRLYKTEEEAERAAAKWTGPNQHPGRYRARPVMLPAPSSGRTPGEAS